jgi:hypothetical protein
MSNIHDAIKKEQEDLLKRKDFAETVLSVINSKEESQVIGLYGGWGTGKTSILNLISDLSEKSNCTVHIEIIDAWQYGGSNILLAAIISRLKKLIKNDLDVHDPEEAYRKMDFCTLALLHCMIKTLTGLGLEDVKHLKEDAKKDVPGSIEDLFALIDEIENTRNEFSKIVEIVLKALKLDKIVLCIDNLDRCLPDIAVNLLESVKNFLSVPGCVWVFALDAEVLASYINKRYEGTLLDGNSYLDKIIIQQFCIPNLTWPDDESCVNALFDKVMNGIPKEKRPNVPDLFTSNPRLLIPRRIIKSSQKFVEISHKSEVDDPDLIFALIYLSFSWPDFYVRFSVDRLGRLLGILWYFMEESERSRYAVFDSKVSLPWAEKFTEDRDLCFFIQQAFLKSGMSDSAAKKILASMLILHSVGLP